MAIVFSTIDNAAEYLAGMMQDDSEIAKLYPNATIAELKSVHFDLVNAVRFSHGIFIPVPHNGTFSYLYEDKSRAEALALAWDFEWDGTVAIAQTH